MSDLDTTELPGGSRDRLGSGSNRSRSRHHLSRSGSAVQLECFRCGIPASVPAEVTLIRAEQVAVGVGRVRSVAAVLVGEEQLASLKVELLGVGDEVHLGERLILGC